MYLDRNIERQVNSDGDMTSSIITDKVEETDVFYTRGRRNIYNGL